MATLKQLQRAMRERWAKKLHRDRYGTVDSVIKERFVQEFPESDLAHEYSAELEKRKGIYD